MAFMCARQKTKVHVFYVLRGGSSRVFCVKLVSVRFSENKNFAYVQHLWFSQIYAFATCTYFYSFCYVRILLLEEKLE